MSTTPDEHARPRVIAVIIVLMTLAIANRATWLCIWEVHKPLFSCEYGTPAFEILAYLVILTLVLADMRTSPLRKRWGEAWRRNGILVAFLLFCLASVTWSVSPILTAVNATLVVLSAVVASYLGVRYRDEQWLRITLWFSGAAVLLSYLLVWLVPGAAIMSTFALEGNWRGVFSHKNYTGAIVAYGSSVIGLAYFTYRRAIVKAGLLLLLVASVILIGFTRSATGVVLLGALLGLLLAFLLWNRFGGRLQRFHYAVAAAILAVLGGALIVSRNSLFALIGRSSNLTGRVPLWAYIIDLTAKHNIWLGYGLWTVWRFLDFRLRAEAALHWSFQVINGHNGFVDVFTYLGLVGLALFSALTVQTLWKTFSYAIKAKTTYAIWIVLTAAYVVLVNLTISFFFQFETFHWVLLVLVLFASTRASALPSAIAPKAAGASGQDQLL